MIRGHRFAGRAGIHSSTTRSVHREIPCVSVGKLIADAVQLGAKTKPTGRRVRLAVTDLAESLLKKSLARMAECCAERAPKRNSPQPSGLVYTMKGDQKHRQRTIKTAAELYLLTVSTERSAAKLSLVTRKSFCPYWRDAESSSSNTDSKNGRR